MSKINNRNSLPLIEIHNIEKEFTINQGLVKSLNNRWKNKPNIDNVIKALNGITFEVNRGEAVGIIGRNGSGKSTLLQIVCGTLSKTCGKVKCRGKIAALLELGSGFNPEFTGRENIVINGLLLGLSKKQIEARMQKIVDFAEIGIFIDQPLKTYSSGMIVRLAFSVIAHVDADILVIDEALAVGDSYFTQKCMRFIQRFKEKGALLFVSHDIRAIANLCNKAVVLEQGNQIFNGDVKTAVDIYNRNVHMQNNKLNIGIDETKEEQMADIGKVQKFEMDRLDLYRKKWSDARVQILTNLGHENKIEVSYFDKKCLNADDYGKGGATIIDTRIRNIEGKAFDNKVIYGGEILALEIDCKADNYIGNFLCGFILKNDKGLTLLGDNTANKFSTSDSLEAGEIVRVQFIFTMPILPWGKYSITASLADGTMKEHNILHWKNSAVLLESQNTSCAAGLAGLPMQSITIERIQQ